MLNSCALFFAAALAAPQDMMPAAPAQLGELKWMLGTHSGRMSMNMGPGMEAEATLTMKAEMKAQFIHLEYKTVMDGIPGEITESGYLGWDQASGQYKMWTFTSMSPSPRVENGRLEGGSLRMLSEPWAGMGPAPMVFRSSMSPKPEGIEFTLEIKQGDGFMKVGTALMKKQG
jgi:hypothetical protein